MIYFFDKNFFKNQDKLLIYNEDGEVKYILRAQSFSLANKISFYNEIGKEMALIKQNIFIDKCNYEVYLGSLRSAVIKTMKNGNNEDVHVMVYSGMNYEASGDFGDYNFNIVCHGKNVLLASDSCSKDSSQCRIEIFEDYEKYDLMLLCFVAVLTFF